MYLTTTTARCRTLPTWNVSQIVRVRTSVTQVDLCTCLGNLRLAHRDLADVFSDEFAFVFTANDCFPRDSLIGPTSREHCNICFQVHWLAEWIRCWKLSISALGFHSDEAQKDLYATLFPQFCQLFNTSPLCWRTMTVLMPLLDSSAKHILIPQRTMFLDDLH